MRWYRFGQLNEEDNERRGRWTGRLRNSFWFKREPVLLIRILWQFTSIYICVCLCVWCVCSSHSSHQIRLQLVRLILITQERSSCTFWNVHLHWFVCQSVGVRHTSAEWNFISVFCLFISEKVELHDCICRVVQVQYRQQKNNKKQPNYVAQNYGCFRSVHAGETRTDWVWTLVSN